MDVLSWDSDKLPVMDYNSLTNNKQDAQSSCGTVCLTLIMLINNPNKLWCYWSIIKRLNDTHTWKNFYNSMSCIMLQYIYTSVMWFNTETVYRLMALYSKSQWSNKCPLSTYNRPICSTALLWQRHEPNYSASDWLVLVIFVDWVG